VHTRCYRCGWNLTLGREAIRAAVASADKQDKYHTERCPRCRQTIKIPIEQLRRSVLLEEQVGKPEAQPPSEHPESSGETSAGQLAAVEMQAGLEIHSDVEIAEEKSQSATTRHKRTRKHRVTPKKL